MKQLALILTILFAAASCALSAADAPKRHGWDNDNLGPLYGNVESVTITSYSLKDSSGVLSRSKIEEKYCYNFNQSGDVTELADYKSDGSLWYKYIYKYDSQGNITEMTDYDGELRPTSQDVYTIIYRK
jgi:YD repeat-containing protein